MLAIGQSTDFAGVRMEVGERLPQDPSEGTSEAALTVQSNGVLVLEVAREDAEKSTVSLINVGSGKVHFAKGSVIVLRREGDMMMPAHEQHEGTLVHETESLASMVTHALINAEATVEGLEDVDVYVERANQSFVKLTSEEKARWGLSADKKETPLTSTGAESASPSGPSTSSTPSTPSKPSTPSTALSGEGEESSQATSGKESSSEGTLETEASKPPLVIPGSTPPFKDKLVDGRLIERQDNVRLEAEALRQAALRRFTEAYGAWIRTSGESPLTSDAEASAAESDLEAPKPEERLRSLAEKRANPYWGVCHPNERYRSSQHRIPLSVWVETHRARLGETTVLGGQSTLRNERVLWGLGTYLQGGPWRARLGLVLSEERWHWSSPLAQKGEAHDLLLGGTLLYQWAENAALAWDWAWNQRRESVRWLAFGDDWITSQGARASTLWSALRWETRSTWLDHHWRVSAGVGALYQGERLWDWRERALGETSRITEPSHLEGHGVFGVSWQSNAWVIAGREWYLGMNLECDWTLTKSHRTLSAQFGNRHRDHAMVYPRGGSVLWGLEWAHKGGDSAFSLKLNGQRGPQRQRDFGVGLLWGLPVNL